MRKKCFTQSELVTHKFEGKMSCKQSVFDSVEDIE